MDGGSGNNDAIAFQQAQQKAAQAATGQINQAFAGYNPAFFQNYQNAVLNAGLPQLQDQYQTAAQQAQYGLSNRGLLNSGAADMTRAGLQSSLDQGRTQLADSAVQAAQQLQQQIASQKANLVSQASVASDPGSVGSSAFGIASGFANPNPLQPIGNMFQTFGNAYLANRLNSTYGNQSGLPYGGFSGYQNPGAASGGSAFGIQYN